MKLAEILEQTLCIDRILEIAGGAPEISEDKPWKEGSAYEFCLPERIRIALPGMRRFVLCMRTI